VSSVRGRDLPRAWRLNSSLLDASCSRGALETSPVPTSIHALKSRSDQKARTRVSPLDILAFRTVNSDTKMAAGPQAIFALSKKYFSQR
jgi:hypothetical protein